MDETFWFYSNFSTNDIATPSAFKDDTFYSICQYGYPDYPSG